MITLHVPSSVSAQSDCELIRKEQMDRLDFMEKQLSMLTREMKDKIRAMVEDVEVGFCQLLAKLWYCI